MLDNFHLAVIVVNNDSVVLQQVPLQQDLQGSLAEDWEDQYNKFIQGKDEIAFDAGYQPEQDENFRLTEYESPAWLAEEDSRTVPGLEIIGHDDTSIDAIKGVAAFARDESTELVLFQNFSRSRVIRPGSSLLLSGDTYGTVSTPGLMLGSKLSAVYWPVERKLIFHNFRTVNTFLPLADVYREASSDEILKVLAHERLAPEDPGAIASDPSQWFRKRFAMLRDSKVLDRYSVDEIKSYGEEHGVSVSTRNGKVVFPANKGSAKKLLQILNEERFRGGITGTLYETNSKKKAD